VPAWHTHSMQAAALILSHHSLPRSFSGLEPLNLSTLPLTIRLVALLNMNSKLMSLFFPTAPAKCCQLIFLFITKMSDYKNFFCFIWYEIESYLLVLTEVKIKVCCIFMESASNLYQQMAQVLCLRDFHVVPPCLYSTLKWANQTLAREWALLHF